MKDSDKRAEWEGFVFQNSTYFDTSYIDQDLEVIVDSSPNVSNKSKKTVKIQQKKCQHLWKVVNNDDIYNYKQCELCGRTSKESRLSKKAGYNEPNPDKKKEINEWFADQQYNVGTAIVLDAKGLKTSNQLLDSGCFTADNIIIPEYDTDTYELNKKDARLGSCMRNGDFLEILKQLDPTEFSLIYADFTGSYKKFVRPLLEYLKSIKKSLRPNVLIAITWSNNGVGNNNTRANILMKTGKYAVTIGLQQLKESPTYFGYGDTGCMNVIFYRKK